MKLRSRVCAAALSAVAALSPGAAQAQEAQPVEAPVDGERQTARARDAFMRGAALGAEGKWRDALAAFEESASVRPHAKTTYNLGFCERALGHTTRALGFFARALEEDRARGGGELAPELRTATEGFLRALQAEIAIAVIELEPPNATLTVDGRPLEVISRGGALPLLSSGTRAPGPGEAPPSSRFELRVDPGSRVFVIAGSDGKSRVVERRFASGAREIVRLSLEGSAAAPAPGGGSEPRSVAAAPAAPSAAQPTEDKPAAAAPSDGRRTAAFVLAGVGLVALGVGTGFGVKAFSDWRESDAGCESSDRCTEEGLAAADSAVLAADVSTVSFVLGGVAMASAVVLFVTSGEGRQATSRVWVRPAAGPGGGGASIGARF